MEVLIYLFSNCSLRSFCTICMYIQVVMRLNARSFVQDSSTGEKLCGNGKAFLPLELKIQSSKESSL